MNSSSKDDPGGFENLQEQEGLDILMASLESTILDLDYLTEQDVEPITKDIIAKYKSDVSFGWAEKKAHKDAIKACAKRAQELNEQRRKSARPNWLSVLVVAALFAATVIIIIANSMPISAKP